MKQNRIAALCLSVLILLAATPTAASADQGVSISLGRIDVSQRLAPGGRYHLPTLSVSNIGDQQQQYEVAINYLQDSGTDRPPRGWFDISPPMLDLAPGESRAVELDIDLPTNADPGSYTALVEAHPVATLDGTKISAAAAARVSFTVKPSSWLQAWRLRINRAFEDYAPWSYLLPMLILAALLLYGTRRNLRVRINVERKH